jgi:hypothetical protein
MRKNTLWVGLDTDKKHIAVAVAEALPDGEVRIWGERRIRRRRSIGWSRSWARAGAS